MKKDGIEEVYRELEGFSKEPPKELWDNIEARLHPKKKRRGIIWFWGSAAAILILLFGYFITSTLEPNNKPDVEVTDVERRGSDKIYNVSEFQTTKKNKKKIVNNPNKDTLLTSSGIAKEEVLETIASAEQPSEKSTIPKKEQSRNSFAENASANKEKSKYNNSYAQNTKEEVGNKVDENNTKISQKDNLDLKEKSKILLNAEKENAIVGNDSISEKKDSPVVLVEELMASNEDLKDSTNTEKIANSKWSVEVLGGLSNTSSESYIQDTSVNTTSQNDFVYALKVGYAVSDRLIVKSGIGKNILGQEISGISYVISDTSNAIDVSQNIVNDQSIVFLASPAYPEDFTTTSGGVINQGDLQQQFDYIQLPLEVSYMLLKEQKYNLSLGIGGNINFLTDNRTFLNNEAIGESVGVNSTIFGATLNSNISYKLAKKINLFLEPSYNYFQKPINNNNQNFKNTQFRALFGLRYKF